MDGGVMIVALMALVVACDGGKGDSAGGTTDDSTTPDDSATDDSGTNKGDDSGKDDSGTDDSGTDDSGGCPKLDWYQDVDGDGYGAGTATSACEAPGKEWTQTDGDCDDALAEVSPDATEICNSIDDDCDTDIDDADSSVEATTWYTDADHDGYGDPTGSSITSCAGGTGYAPEDAKHPPDCNDADDAVYPGAPELCDDVQTDCNTKVFEGDVGVATFYPASGGAEDWTADMAAGKYGAAEKIDITDDGELVICDGTWYVGLTINASNVTVRGLHGSEVTTISGGDDKRTFAVLQSYAVVTAEGLTLTEANGCYGAAVSTVQVSSCSTSSAGGSYSSGVDLTLKDVTVVDNAPTLLALATVMVTYGNLTVEDSTIANNSQTAMWAEGNFVTCTATDPKSDNGIWGNGGGVNMYDWSGDPLVFESDSCDFDGVGGTYTPYNDLYMYSGALKDDATFDFGDDATFLCDASVLSCAK
jgi:hypothetical protein